MKSLNKPPKTLFILALLPLALQCFIFRGVEKATFHHDPLNDSPSGVRVYWIGHATVLIRMYDKWIITDPVFSNNIGVVVRRYFEPGLNLERLPVMDWVLISHTHLDHLDKPSLRRLKSSRNLLVPEGGATYVPDGLFRRTLGVKVGQRVEEDGVRVTVVGAQHFGGRCLIDNLWDGEPYQGYVIEYRDTTIFFAGDTGYNPHLFKKIGESFKIDIALIPVGPSGSAASGQSFRRRIHADPFEAVQLFRDTNARWMVPIHFGTFYRKGDDERKLVQKAIEQSGMQGRILPLDIGQAIEFSIKDNKFVLVGK